MCICIWSSGEPVTLAVELYYRCTFYVIRLYVPVIAAGRWKKAWLLFLLPTRILPPALLSFRVSSGRGWVEGENTWKERRWERWGGGRRKKSATKRGQRRKYIVRNLPPSLAFLPSPRSPPASHVICPSSEQCCIVRVYCAARTLLLSRCVYCRCNRPKASPLFFSSTFLPLSRLLFLSVLHIFLSLFRGT